MSDSILARQMERKIAAFDQQNGRKPKVLLLSESEGTFGHARVTSTLAKRISEMGGEVVVASGDIDEETFGFDGTLKNLPLVIHTFKDKKVFETTPEGTIYLEDTAYMERRKQALLDIANEFKPDVIAFEFHPIAIKRFRVPDVEALLQYRRENEENIPFVTIARDSTVNSFSEEQQEMLKDFDHILLRGWKDIQWSDTAPMPLDIAEKTQHLGHILADKPANDNNLPKEKQPVMVFSSGGFQASDKLFFDKAIEASKHGEFAGQPWKIVISKECPDEIFRQYQEKAEKDGNGKITVTHTYDNRDFIGDLANCATAIVRGSYNASLELASMNKPFVIVPRTLPGFSFENENRAKFMAEKGLCTTITETELSMEDGAKKLADKMQDAVRIEPVEAMEYENGSQFAARLLQIAMQKQVRKQSKLLTEKDSGRTTAAQTR